MRKLLSLPENLVKHFHAITGKDKAEYFCTADPKGKKVGSGGGTAWIMNQCWKQDNNIASFNDWLAAEKRIIIHAGGQSRRLPAYAASGKVLAPIPVFRWERGQSLDQNLLDLQLPLYEKIIKQAPDKVNTLIASGDVYIRSNYSLPDVPEADVICYGLWGNEELASNHGVFVCDKQNAKRLKYMLQKPSVKQLKEESRQNFYLMDIGIWLLSDKAIECLMEASECLNDAEAIPAFYDLYGQMGLALGDTPQVKNSKLNNLTVAIVPLNNGEFYHYGTSPELISSTLKIQNRVIDQRSILHNDNKPHPSLFVQNSLVSFKLTEENQNIWIENSYISNKWKLSTRNIITGVPENSWSLNLDDGICVDITPVYDNQYVVRPYGIKDAFRGRISDCNTGWLNRTLKEWLHERELAIADLSDDVDADIQNTQLFPVVDSLDKAGRLLEWMLGNITEQVTKEWKQCERMSADEISEKANLVRLFAQRKSMASKSWPLLKFNHHKSIFYQLDLERAACDWAKNSIEELPETTSPDNPLKQMQEHMFRARVNQLNGLSHIIDEEKAFGVLQRNVIEQAKNNPVIPRFSVFRDQIVWGRSPIRIDFAGGWTDTPPYCLVEGGNVVNAAFNLNGQPPLQVFIRASEKREIVIRSIDLGTREIISSWDNLATYKSVGSEFSIAKAALSLVGFHPDFCVESFSNLQEQLKLFGSGIEISTLAAIPKGSGLGTSSILAATVLGALADFCGLGWDHFTVCQKALVLEQMLTTGGGWQDQFGGVTAGVKLLESTAGITQAPTIKWAPDYLFKLPESKECMLLYYTGITRTAKDILADIVRGMFLNNSDHLNILKEMKMHALNTFEIIQKGNLGEFAHCIRTTWAQKQQIDAGTNPDSIKRLIRLFDDYALGYKLPGAGGGGYMYIIAKDPSAAGIIRGILTQNAPNPRARFVDLDISSTGLQITRS
ncbi:bifunctional fucokinase/L-fucose-1-P-guanylyltransferase [Prolixibacteraceae bacterium JC049]|nr:bifunctional fucokinase/L-fucose-1-P-guanylyltransferase [Prolixibacteraceae bacterium JC049]